MNRIDDILKELDIAVEFFHQALNELAHEIMTLEEKLVKREKKK